MRESFCGHVVLAGMTNVGKSSLLNALMDKKISIVSSKPQTTRDVIYGVFSTSLDDHDRQAILVDTPGEFNTAVVTMKKPIKQKMMQGLYEGQIVLLVIDAKNPQLSKNDVFLKFILGSEVSTIVAINKIDLLKNKNQLLPLIEDIAQACKTNGVEVEDFIPISVKTNHNISLLREIILTKLPQAPLAYKENETRLNEDSFMACELLREQIFRFINREIPFGIRVVCDKIEQKTMERKLKDNKPKEYKQRTKTEKTKKLNGDGDRKISKTANPPKPTNEKIEIKFIYLTIMIRKEGHKAIILGKKGEQIKTILTKARMNMEELFGSKVMLKCHIKLDPKAK